MRFYVPPVRLQRRDRHHSRSEHSGPLKLANGVKSDCVSEEPPDAEIDQVLVKHGRVDRELSRERAVRASERRPRVRDVLGTLRRRRLL